MDDAITNKCRICGNLENNSTHAAREMFFGLREPFTYIECAACGCLQIARVPDDLARHYPSDYYAFSHSESNWKPPSNLRRFLKRHHVNRELGGQDAIGTLVSKRFPHWGLSWLGYAKPTYDTPILDVGSGTGQTLHGLSEAGFTNLTGVDPFIERDLSFPNGVKILKREISEIEGSYRLVHANHAFEHMPDPEASLREMARVLDRGCLIVIRIPVSCCAAWKKYGINWAQLDAPRHLFLHNERTMSILCGRVGLVLENVAYDSTSFQFTASEGYVRDIPMVEQDRGKMFSKAETAAFEMESGVLNATQLGDQATFYLRKL